MFKTLPATPHYAAAAFPAAMRASASATVAVAVATAATAAAAISGTAAAAHTSAVSGGNSTRAGCGGCRPARAR